MRTLLSTKHGHLTEYRYRAPAAALHVAHPSGVPRAQRL